ncbi:MAG: hypothetical protein J0I77_03150 [Rudaea sp.]|uniref:hypothetical protein n=1 Tax=unclassified Rudaea TaxID=2627037 RepID=UPI0010F5034F|nr:MULTISPECIES: hypothetical protein [unclassified Rudaea]MBN8884693.1 hypothetical protein [Rudaea sp.]MBR0347883.1 hypothetical protein [Rudaea sp.]
MKRMGSKLSLFGLATSCALTLVGCAPEAMRPEQRDKFLADQFQKISTLSECCADWSAASFKKSIESQSSDFEFGTEASLVHKFGGQLLPIEGFALPTFAKSYQLDFVSFSSGRYSALRFDNKLFIRANALLLDASFTTIKTIENPPAFAKQDHGDFALYTRFTIDRSDAAYIVFYPSLSPATQQIDTRLGSDGTLGMAPGDANIASSIADARKSYLADLTLGISGLAALRVSR